MTDLDTAASPRARASAGRASWGVVALLAVVAVVVRLPAFLSSRHLLFDDGVYGVSVIAMRHGMAPYSGVFSAQGPLHFPLLYVGDLLGFRTIDSPRVTPVVAGAVAAIGVWAIARRCSTETAALLAGLLVATTGTMLWTTGQITGDGPASALAVCAVWAAVCYRDRPALARAILTGIAMGAAIAVKPLAITAAIPVGWWLWSRRRTDHLGAAVGAAGLTWLASALPWGMSLVWQQSIEYNIGAGPRYSHLSQFRKLWSTLGDRDLVLVVAVGLGLIAAALAARGRMRPVPGGTRTDTILVAAWCAATAALLVLEPAMYRNHLAALVPPLALLFALRPPPLRWFVLALIVTVPWSIVHLNDILRPDGYRGNDAALVRDLRALPEGARVISDDPGFVWRAGRVTPPLMNDASIKRIDQDLLTTRTVSEAAARDDTCAVVIWSARFGDALPGLRPALQRAGYEQTEHFAHNHELWTKTGCRAGQRTGSGAPSE